MPCPALGEASETAFQSKRQAGQNATPQDRSAKARQCAKGRAQVLHATQETEIARLTRELDEAREELTATSEVLRVISSSPSNLDPILQTILANATRICEANFGILNLPEGEAFPVAAMHNAPQAFAELRRREPTFHLGPKHPLALVAVTKQVLSIPTSGRRWLTSKERRRTDGLPPCGRSDATYRADAKTRPSGRHD